jgi:hypothetical protein
LHPAGFLFANLEFQTLNPKLQTHA